MIKIILSILCYSSFSYAFWNFDFSQFESVDKYFSSQANISFRNWTSDIFYGYTNEKEFGCNWGGDFSYQESFLTPYHSSLTRTLGVVGNKFSKTNYLEIKLGVGQIHHFDFKELNTSPIGEVNGKHVFNSQIYWSWLIGRDFLMKRLIFPAGMNEYLKSYQFNNQATFNLIPRFKLKVSSLIDFMEDENRKHDYDMQLMYGISPGTPWIWAGFGGGLIENTKTNFTYWSPRRFASYGPRLELNTPIYNLLSAYISLNSNKIRENDLAWGQGYYGAGGLLFGDRNNYLIKLGIEKIESVQAGRWWHSNTYVFNLSSHF